MYQARAYSTALLCYAPMSPEQQQLQSGIQALEAQRGLLGDAVVDMAAAPLKAKLAALAALPSEPAQALKQVSILFLDVVGSTTLAQRLDPEAISAVMDGALARGTAVVQAHRGKVLQSGLGALGRELLGQRWLWRQTAVHGDQPVRPVVFDSSAVTLSRSTTSCASSWSSKPARCSSAGRAIRSSPFPRGTGHRSGATLPGAAQNPCVIRAYTVRTPLT